MSDASRKMSPARPLPDVMAVSCPPDVASNVFVLTIIVPPGPLAVVRASMTAPSEMLKLLVFTSILPPTPEELVLVNIPLETPSTNSGGDVNLGGV
jgi:hypothetical protein